MAKAKPKPFGPKGCSSDCEALIFLEEHERVDAEHSRFRAQRDVELRRTVAQLRFTLRIARHFVEGKALTPDVGLLLAIDALLKETKSDEEV